MGRFALLIDSSNVEGLTDLPGARNDIENWKNFLTSKLGGRWRYSSYGSDNEIMICKKPMSGTVTTLLNDNRDKYCFVAFAGHGFHDPKRGDYVCLNDYNKECPLSLITPKSNQGTLVVDACRGFEDAHVSVGIKKAVYEQRGVLLNNSHYVTAANSASPTVSLSSSYAGLDQWESLLRSGATGIVQMLSCAIGEAADDIRVGGEEIGGIYTTTLMKSARNWEQVNQYASVYSTKEAHDDTVQYMSTNYPQQHPDYSPSYLAYPFALK